jgi:hypothetical protein
VAGDQSSKSEPSVDGESTPWQRRSCSDRKSIEKTTDDRSSSLVP